MSRGRPPKSVAQWRMDANGCWVWLRSRIGPYGQAGNELAHRYFYRTYVGPIPKRSHIDHLCRNRLCVNPRHLEAVTPRVNILRGVGASALNARKTHCLRGHPFDSANTTRLARGGRSCRACEHQRKRRYAHAAAA